MSERAYFDWNATAPLRQEARAAMVTTLGLTGNASSVHAEGRAVRRLVEAAREQVAGLVGAEAKGVTFTSGATEANMLALTPAIEIGGRKSLRDRLFVSAIEHPSVRSGGRFPAAQVEELPVTGAGALVSRGDIHIGEPLIKGGGQERSQRAGTENVAAIAGFGAAAAVAANQADVARMAGSRDRLEAGIKAILPEALIFGESAPRLPNTTLFAVPGMKAETAIISFDLNGIAVSSGSACSSGKVQASHVLAAMGVEPSLAQGAVRVSLGWSTGESDIENLLDALTKVVSSLRKGHMNAGLAA